MAIPASGSTDDPLLQPHSGDAREPFPVTEPGRALALADFSPPSASAGERLIRFAYRMGLSGSVLSAPFRRPARPHLLATVESPLPGDRVAGMALRSGHFLVYGVKAPIAQIDFSSAAKLTPPFERVVHGFSWLRDIEAAGTRQQSAATAERVLGAWLDANPGPGKGAAWRVGNAGHRALAWIVHAPLIMSNSESALCGRVLEALEATARWLDRNTGKAGDRLEELAAWCAITAAGLLLPQGKPRRLYGEAGLARVLGDLVGNDGGVLSRSPLDQMEAIGLLIDLTACYRAAGLDTPDILDTMLQLLVPPLLALTHGEGGLGNWQGCGAISAARVNALVDAAQVRTRPLRDARQWGYQRAVAGKTILQFDAAPPPLARHARHGCASTLSFEMSHLGQRIVVNCGGAAFAGGQVPVRIEQGLRASAAHSTLVLGDANSTAVLINGRLGSGVNEVEVERRTLDTDNGVTATRIEASHDGYVPRFGLIHRRLLMLRDDGLELRGADLLVPGTQKGKRGKVPFAIRFHLGPEVDASLWENGRGAGLALPDGSYWQFLAENETLELEESIWIDGDGKPHPVQQLVVQGLVSRGGGSFSWLLKKAG
ncbi:heparinase [Altererythrobacter xixiisoli]|uniref:Heparinase n=2 Tax=Croceibacterium xixiisoli TaxID=1476466 RepID=A0A6I4TQ80_9SPHN|nr:heparinase [Croceibacterium xixiisoli]